MIQLDVPYSISLSNVVCQQATQFNLSHNKVSISVEEGNTTRHHPPSDCRIEAHKNSGHFVKYDFEGICV